jgi:hypothetical protein
MQPIQIDPAGCGCTECLTGEYVPLDRATDAQVFALLRGELSDATSEKFTLTVVAEDYLNGGQITETARAEYSGRTWTVEHES